jgi:hypothetical protein
MQTVTTSRFRRRSSPRPRRRCRRWAIQRDLLSALAGRFPSQEPKETFTLAKVTLPVDLPVSLPLQLVEQRPDVRSAEQLLHSASAQVGVATANMLPNITIGANGAYSLPQLAGLIAPQNVFWLLAGNATQTVFDGFSLLHINQSINNPTFTRRIEEKASERRNGFSLEFFASCAWTKRPCF